MGENIYMKNLSRFFVGAAALVLLTACGPSKVSYAKFHEQAAAAAEKDPGYTKATAKGTVYASVAGAEITIKVNNKFVKGDDGWELAEGEESTAGTILVAFLLPMRAVDVTEDEKTTYYAGNGFKTVSKDDDGNGTVTFNANGYVTSMKGKTESGKADLKFSWSK